MNVIICDDEKEIVESLYILIKNKLNNNDKITKHTKYNELIKDIKTKQIDLLFLDIKLKEENGIEICKNYKDYLKDTKIVYITGYNEYIEEVFEANPFYLLIKPIDQTKIDKIFKKINNQQNNYLTIKYGKTINKININKIIYIESHERIIEFHLEDNTSIQNYNKLSEIIKELNKDFIKVHKSYIVNLNKIKKYKLRELTMINNTIIPISRLNANIVKKRIINYIGE